ncbi:lipopolysaccharide biosynthesis protein [Virgibacillus oceani]|uniref:Polysaccharide biosynthesis protein n=1 Tax=Virgibacillus oceani TaxID=1479511 RepID=A0A917HAQ6_9BACI|nr:lipopolysaccharide biosynthesis protein [Virgibacillus oceani]GGG73235.1 polysaccharide biosynthesis protein [Virgibacillus oceani]
MKDKILRFIKRPFIRNVTIIASGTATAQVITMLLSPIITRLYGPEVYGLMGVFMAIVGVIVPISALTYPIAIVLPKSDKDAKGLIYLSLYVSVIITIIITFTLLFLKQPIVDLFQIKEVSSYLFLIPLVILSSGILQVIEQWLYRTNQFRITAKTIFLHALILQGSIIGIGIFYPVATVLITLSALGNGLKAIIMILIVRNSNYKKSINLSKKNISIKSLAKTYNDFPIYRAPEVFLNAASQSLPILLLSSFFGPASAGFYTIAKTALGAPSQLIGKAIGDVFYPRISQAANKDENLTILIKKATTLLFLIGIIPFGIVIIFGPWIFSFVFGEEWVVAGEYARWIALWSFFMFINRPAVKSLPVLSAQAFHLTFTLITLITRVLVLIIGYYVFADDIVAVAFFGVSGALLNIFLILKTLKISKKYDKLNKVK